MAPSIIMNELHTHTVPAIVENAQTPTTGNHDNNKFGDVIIEVPCHTKEIEMNPKPRPSLLFRKTCIEVIDLSYKVIDNAKPYSFMDKLARKEPERRTILSDICGSLIGGRMTSILGPSGAGKSTFLNILSGHSMQGETYGKILLDGKECHKHEFQSTVAFVPQHDLVSPALTVREAIYFSAQTRVKGNSKSHNQLAQDVIDKLGLSKVSDSIVGDERQRGLSGGEKKRVSIGLELVTSPAVIFADEPTSGLDSSVAYSVMKELKNLAMEGRNVVCTIHQPNTKVFNLFDDLILFHRTGHIVYWGSIANIPSFLNDLGLSGPAHYNLADFLLEMVSEYELSFFKTQPTASLMRREQKLLNITESTSSSTLFESSWLTQFIALIIRQWKEFFRNRSQVRWLIVKTLFMATMAGLVFYQVGNGSSIMNLLSLVYFVLATVGMELMMSSILCFPQPRPVFRREVNRNYSVSSYFLAMIANDIPVRMVLISAVYVAITYTLGGLSSDPKDAFLFYGMIVLNSLAFHATGTLSSSIASNVNVAVELATLTVIPFMLISGFFMAPLPEWLSIVSYIDPLKYSFQILATNQVSGKVGGDVFLLQRGIDITKSTDGTWIACIIAYIIIVYSISYVFLYRSASAKVF